MATVNLEINQIEDKIKSLVMEKLDLEESEINVESSITNDLGGDSLDYIEIIMAIEETFDIIIDYEELERVQTIGDVIDIVKDHIDHPEKNRPKPEANPRRTTYMYDWIRDLERENETILSSFFTFRRSFVNTDDSSCSLYSDIYKYSCGGTEMFEDCSGIRLLPEELRTINIICQEIDKLQRTLDIICRVSSDCIISENKSVDSLIVEILQINKHSLELRVERMNDRCYENAERREMEVSTITRCLKCKLLFLKLKICSFIGFNESILRNVSN